MPKLKTHSGCKKRMKKTKNGKIKRRKAGAGHLLTQKSAKKKRQLKKPGLVTGKIADKISKLI